MSARYRRFAVSVAFVAAATASTVGCRSETWDAPPAYADLDDTYDPEYFDGYVVYYDAIGRPYHYADGAVVWISTAAPQYDALVDHWKRHHVAYRRWYVSYGYRYRSYHGGPRDAYAETRKHGGFW